MGALAIPKPRQAAWQDREIGLFIHYDIHVFKTRLTPDWDHRHYDDWPSPDLFNPRKLDTEQWMEAADALGAKYAILTASHGTGFMLWQSDAYPFGVRQSPWRGGKGDVVRDFVDSCRRHGIAPGLYSHLKCNGYWRVDHPGLVNEGKGGDPARQAEYARARMTMCRELWGNYGPLGEIWFDGGMPDPALSGYDAEPLIRALQPEAIVLQSTEPDIRWIGNERGMANNPCWATVPSAAEMMSWEGRGMNDMLGSGDPGGAAWMPAECDVPLRRGQWMWYPGEDHLIKPVDELMDVYERSVGRNCNLLINANPDTDGRIPDADMRRYREFGDAIRRQFGTCLAETSGTGREIVLPLPRPATIDRAIIMEEIAEGERVRAYVVEGLADGGWTALARGISVGHKRIERFAPVTVSSVRLRVERDVAEPAIRRFAVFAARERS